MIVALNVAVWALLVLFFIIAGLVLVGTYRGDTMVTTDRPRLLVTVVHPAGADPAPAVAALQRQEYPDGLLQVTAVPVSGKDGFEDQVRDAAAHSDAEIVLVADAACTVKPYWADRCAACFIPGVAMVRCGRSGNGMHGLDLVLTQAVEAGLTGLGARLLPDRPGFGVRTAVLMRGMLEPGERVRFTRVRGSVLHERDSHGAVGVRALAAWFRRTARASRAGSGLVYAGGAAAVGCAAALCGAGADRWQPVFAFFYAALLFGAMLPLYLRGASFLRQSRLLGAVVPHALRWLAVSLPAFAVLVFSRPARVRRTLQQPQVWSDIY